VESEPSPAESDGAGRYQDDLAAVRLESRDCVHNRFDPFQGKVALGACDRAGSQFNDHSFCAAQEAVSALLALMWRFAHLIPAEFIRVRHSLPLSNSKLSGKRGGQVKGGFNIFRRLRVKHFEKTIRPDCLYRKFCAAVRENDVAGEETKKQHPDRLSLPSPTNTSHYKATKERNPYFGRKVGKQSWWPFRALC
jgi:hypothetical protein